MGRYSTAEKYPIERGSVWTRNDDPNKPFVVLGVHEQIALMIACDSHGVPIRGKVLGHIKIARFNRTPKLSYQFAFNGALSAQPDN